MINIKSFLGLDYYTSGLDKFLTEFDKSHPKLSESQLAEIKKYQRIYKLRDDAAFTDHQDNFWDKFQG